MFALQLSPDYRFSSQVGTYLCEASECESLLIEWPDSARFEVENAAKRSACDLCGVFRAPRYYYETASLIEWLQYFNAEVAPRTYRSLAVAEIDQRSKHSELEAIDRCVCCDYQLAPTISIPRNILVAIAPRLTFQQSEYLMTDFLVAACGNCRNSQLGFIDTSEQIMNMHCHVKGIDAREFSRSKQIELFRSIALLIDAAARGRAV
jgi:hypothetical protein